MDNRKPGKVSLILSGKAGEGKSSVSLTLGREISQYGFETLLLELTPATGSYDLLLGLERGICSLQDFLRDECALEDCLLSVPGEPGLYTILAPIETDFVFEPAAFAEKIAALRARFHTILIEVPGGFGSAFFASAPAADDAVIITRAQQISVRDSRTVSDRLDAFALKQWLIINRLDVKDFRKNRPFPDLDAVIDAVGAQLLGIVPEDAEIQKRLPKGLALREESPARIAIENIALRMLGEKVQIGV